MRNYTLINNESNLNSFEQQSIDWQKQYALNEGVLNNTNPINAHRFQNTLGVQSYNNLRCKTLFFEIFFLDNLENVQIPFSSRKTYLYLGLFHKIFILKQ